MAAEMRDAAEQVEGVRVIGHGSKNRPAELLDVRQPPGIEVGDGLLQGLIDSEVHSGPLSRVFTGEG